jgi:hypothetical protein
MPKEKDLMRRTILAALLPVALSSLALGDTGRCVTYEQKTMEQWHTICDDGTRAVSRYNKGLNRYETTITESPKSSCTGRLHPITKQVEVRYR